MFQFIQLKTAICLNSKFTSFVHKLIPHGSSLICFLNKFISYVRLLILLELQLFLQFCFLPQLHTLVLKRFFLLKRSITESIDFIFSNAKAQKYEPCEMFEIPSSVNIPRDFDQVHSFIHSLYFSL